MPSKKRKYNARFPAGRIKKIMQTDEEVGKVAQAVPIIISRTLELFVESLLSKAMQVTLSRNAKTLSPSHVKQCILAESRFDFLKDLVKNIPDVSIAEEKEMLSEENSPNSSRFADHPVTQSRKIIREDSTSSSSSDIKIAHITPAHREIKRDPMVEAETNKFHKLESITSTIVSTDTVIDLSTKPKEEPPRRTANFYQETLLTDEVQHSSVIKVNPTFSNPQPSTSSYTKLTVVEPLHRVAIPVPKPENVYVDVRHNNTSIKTPTRTPVTPILNIDFSKNLTKPEIKVLDTSVANMVGLKSDVPKSTHKLPRQNSKPHKPEQKWIEPKIVYQPPVNIDHLNSGDLQIDEDYDT